MDGRVTDEQAKAIAGVVEEARSDMETGLRLLIDDARAGKPSAVKKLQIFGTIRDPALATKLALMNHEQRRRFLAGQKKIKGRRSAMKNGGAGKKKERRK